MTRIYTHLASDLSKPKPPIGLQSAKSVRIYATLGKPIGGWALLKFGMQKKRTTATAQWAFDKPFTRRDLVLTSLPSRGHECDFSQKMPWFLGFLWGHNKKNISGRSRKLMDILIPSLASLLVLPMLVAPRNEVWFKPLIEGSLEVKLPTIWRDEKQSREEAERRERLEERRSEEKESQERRCRCAKR